MKKKRFISTSFLLLGVVSLLNDFSSEMIMPILPMLITSLGGAGISIGLIGGIRDSISSLLTVLFGYLSDKTGKRKIFVFMGYFTSAVFKLLLAASKTWNSVLIFAGIERIGKSIRTAPRDAIISDLATNERGRGFGIHRAFDTAGAVLGSIAVLLLFWFFGLGFNKIIFIAALLSFTSLIPLYFVKVKDHKIEKKVFTKLSLKILPKGLKIFMVIAAIFALANFSYMFMILKAQGTFLGRAGTATAILLYILYNIFYASLSIPFGKLSDRIGRDKVLIAGYILFALTMLGFAISKSLPSFIALFVMYGTVYAMTDGIQRAFVSDLSSKKIRGTALGTFHTTIGLVALPSSLIAGALWQITPTATFIYGSTLSGIAAIMFLVLRTDIKKDLNSTKA